MNIFDIVKVQASADPKLDLIRLGGNPVDVVPFTGDGELIPTHYLDDPDFRGYCHCNQDESGKGCVLCDLGYPPSRQFLLPVYVPERRRVELLSISTAQNPSSLLPQVLKALPAAGTETLQFWTLKKQGQYGFSLTAYQLPQAADDGAAVIKNFLDDREAGRIIIADAIPRHSDEALRALNTVAVKLLLREGVA